MTALVWFRNDLRTLDNTALHHAAKAGEPLRALYIATPGQWQLHGTSKRQQSLIAAALRQLSASLAKLGVPLDVEIAELYRDIPELLQDYCHQHKITALHANREYLLNEMSRDQQVSEKLSIACHWHHDRLLVPPDALLNGSGLPYRVFTPFAKSWRRQVQQSQTTVLKRPRAQSEAIAPSSIPSFCKNEAVPAWPDSEDKALKRLRTFCAERVQDYDRLRDLPAVEGTSQLSASLAIGLLSPRQCLARLQAEAREHWQEENGGEATWLNELIWREFYQHVAYHFPQVVKGHAFRSETDNIRWSTNTGHFQAWCEGLTGFPIVDAGMRQLKKTGWMHNRLRMITAGFLVKDLHIDWRWGERYFMEQLIDGEFAANNGGWQWSASTGTDAAPYFRIFNPTTQGKRFDPEGDFIRRHVPELAHLGKREIHNPPASASYPPPIVDHAMARKITLELFQAVR